MQIIDEIQLDFSDVLIKPRRSSLESRSLVNITRDYYFNHSQKTTTGTGIMQSNMGTIGTFEVSRRMLANGLFACLHKHHKIEDLIKFYDSLDEDEYDRCFLAIGLRDKGVEKLASLYKEFGSVPPICIDVPNAYIPSVKNLVVKMRQTYPLSVIMVGNVVTGDITEDFILSGADIVKVGIGNGAQCLLGKTNVKTKTGDKKIQDIIEGDEVLTHTGEYHKVLATAKYAFHKEKLNVNGIECTPEHKFLVINKSDKDIVNDDNLMDYAYWEEACQLDESKQLIVKRS